MKWSLNLGRYAGVKILIHWTFLILIGWIIMAELKGGGNMQAALVTVGFVLSVFFCVILHEFGHILTARKFGVNTTKITLLPIGGVASLERMPEEPRKEFLIAAAGPAVNVVIAGILYLTIPEAHMEAMAQTMVEGKGGDINARTFFPWLMSVNMLLVVFNIIPAFPMDGGRIFRALLGFYTTRVQATRIASGLGQFIAIFFVFAGFFGNPFLILIGIFVFLGAYSENVMVQNITFMQGHKIRDAMLTHFVTLKADDRIRDAADKLLEGSDQDFIVEENGKVIGIVTRTVLIEALRHYEWNTSVQYIMNKKFITADVNDSLPEIYQTMQTKQQSLIPVLENGVLKGVINTENIAEFLMIQSAQH